jgi:hypothetical protein
VKSFNQILEAPDPVWVAYAIQPLARRGLEEALKVPWRNVFRDLIAWDDSVRAAWRRSFTTEAP